MVENWFYHPGNGTDAQSHKCKISRSDEDEWKKNKGAGVERALDNLRCNTFKK
jgi:hypothetical protein